MDELLKEINKLEKLVMRRLKLCSEIWRIDAEILELKGGKK